MSVDWIPGKTNKERNYTTHLPINENVLLDARLRVRDAQKGVHDLAAI